MQPALMPSAAATPPRAPSCSVRVTVYRKSTPGVAFSTSTVRTNSPRSWVPNMLASSADVAGSEHLKRHGGCFAAADAECRHAALAAGLFQRAEQRHDDARARRADRVSERAGTTMDVHLVVRQLVFG